jgi:hypothetical protein
MNAGRQRHRVHHPVFAHAQRSILGDLGRGVERETGMGNLDKQENI